jgi:hypothetical protein
MVVTPIPACFIWPGVVLPAVMLAFLAEGSKVSEFVFGKHDMVQDFEYRND